MDEEVDSRPRRRGRRPPAAKADTTPRRGWRLSSPARLVVFSLVGFVVVWLLFHRARADAGDFPGRRTAHSRNVVGDVKRRAGFFKGNLTPPPLTPSPATARRQRPLAKPLNMDPRQRTAGHLVDASLFRLVEGKDVTSDYDLLAVPGLTTAEKTMTVSSGRLAGRRVFEYLDAGRSPFQFLWVSHRPRIAYLPEFLTDEECDGIIAAAAPSLRRSEVAVRLKEGNTNPVQDVRTSRQTWLSSGDSPIVAAVMQRVLNLTGFRAGDMEPLQVLYYNVSAKYDAHTDYFAPSEYGPRTRNRAATLFLYLNDVEEGGETWFPNADGKTPWHDWTSCDRGLKVHPRKRMAVLFYDMMPDGSLDPASLHGGCPVRKGHKWGGTLWMSADTP